MLLPSWKMAIERCYRKKCSLPNKYSTANTASKSRVENSVVGTKENSTKTVENYSMNIVGNHRQDNSVVNKYVKSESLKATVE